MRRARDGGSRRPRVVAMADSMLHGPPAAHTVLVQYLRDMQSNDPPVRWKIACAAAPDVEARFLAHFRNGSLADHPGVPRRWWALQLTSRSRRCRLELTAGLRHGHRLALGSGPVAGYKSRQVPARSRNFCFWGACPSCVTSIKSPGTRVAVSTVASWCDWPLTQHFPRLFRRDDGAHWSPSPVLCVPTWCSARRALCAACGPRPSFWKKSRPTCWQPLANDGQRAEAGGRAATISGPAGDLLTAERLLLNMIGRLSGVATLSVRVRRDRTAQWCNGLRHAEDDARVAAAGEVRRAGGGGSNHRTGLFDAVLIEDNHLAKLGLDGHSAGDAVELARSRLRELRDRDAQAMIVEVEVDSLPQLDDVLPRHPDIVLLDNMAPRSCGRPWPAATRCGHFARWRRPAAWNVGAIGDIAETGVDRISVARLTTRPRPWTWHSTGGEMPESRPRRLASGRWARGWNIGLRATRESDVPRETPASPSRRGLRRPNRGLSEPIAVALPMRQLHDRDDHRVGPFPIPDRNASAGSASTFSVVLLIPSGLPPEC